MFPNYKLLKGLLVSMIIAILLNVGLTGYSIVRHESSDKEFAERMMYEAQEREAKLATKLDVNIQRQILGIRENFINWQIDQVAQTRKLVALEVSSQLKAKQNAAPPQ
ncbi:hypothetical protein PsexTeo8_21140 [Pseudomonas extremaustralis]|uniref:hypothetical protein n=1 Tax=Pseudomonas extremaustralis TaxID=359110 RepID=UPI002AA0DA26|nr:hypothetical protein [Pseudomonas extremaustralis]MDY7065669.1 hypothetical protein [Pseudomonas extremaustralis]